MKLLSDNPTKRDNALRMAVRNRKSMRDGCMVVVAGRNVVSVYAYGDLLFEQDLRDGSLTINLPHFRRWAVQKVNACLSGVNASIRAFTSGDHVAFTDNRNFIYAPIRKHGVYRFKWGGEK